MARNRRVVTGANGLFALLTIGFLLVASTPFWAKAAAPSAQAAVKKPVVARKPLIARPHPAVGKRLSLHKVFRKSVPVSISDLAAIESHVQKLVPRLVAATVSVRIGSAQGSGVIVSKDGYILTAAHVSRTPGEKVTVTLPDGKIIFGITLGRNRGIDAGLIKITTKGIWPFAPLGDMAQVKAGDWCIAIGHPGGFKKGRTPVVRLGRVLQASSSVIRSDAVLVGGDSGGPLFDMHGRVIGVNSRIGRPTTYNFHVPVSAYSGSWLRLARAEEWGRSRRRRRPVPTTRAVIGISGELHAKGCRITDAPADYPAAKAGVKVGDVITRFDGKPVKGFDGLVRLVAKKKPGDKVLLELLRGKKTIKVTVVMIARKP